MKKGTSLFLLFSLLCSLFYPLNANERDNIESKEDSAVETQGASSLSFSDTGISSSSSSSSSPVESTREASDNFLCRVCGNTLFSRDQHIHGPILTGPRIVSVKSEPELGELGSLHDISRSNVNGFVSTALFDPSLPNGVAVGAMSDSSTFAGYNQRQILCGRCGQPIGWRFDSLTSVYATGPAMTAGKSSVDNSGSITPATLNNGVNSPSFSSSSTSPSSSMESDPYVGIPKIVAPYSVSEEDFRLSSLLNANCLQLSKGYWSFEFCHKVRINQYHAEANGGKDPVWSLGEYDTSGKVERTRPLSSASGYYTSHFYTGGQLCHETNKGRSSEVQFFCCPHLAVPSLEEVEEPSICRYRVRVCVPSVCIPDPVAVAALVAAKSLSTTDRPASFDSSIPPSSSLTDSSHGGEDFLNENNNEGDFSNNKPSSSMSSSSAASTFETVDPSILHSSTTSTTSITSTISDGKYPIYGPGSIFDPNNVPTSFIAAAWHTILGDKGDTMKELEEGELSTGIAQVRF